MTPAKKPDASAGPSAGSLPPQTQKTSVTQYDLGVAYDARRNPPVDLPRYQEAVRVSPNRPDAWYNLGLAYEVLEERATPHYKERMVEAYEQAVRLDPDFFQAWHNLGLALGELGRREEEIRAYREVLRLRPNDARVWSDLGIPLRKLGRNTEAIAAYKTSLRLDPTSPDAARNWYNLGVAYEKSGLVVEAIASYRQATSLNADHFAAWQNIAVLMHRQGNAREVQRIAEQLRRIDGRRADEFLRRLLQ
jgi:tetratricopeptide (TPR) repeat protein